MLLDNAKNFVFEMLDTMERKNHDYAGWEEYKNFTLVEKLWVCSVEQWVLVRMSDKFSRLSTLLNKEAKVKDETITDTLIDLANYSIILASYLKDKWEEKVKYNGFTRKNL